MGQLPAGAISLVQTVADAEAFTPRDPTRLAYVTQTTLSAMIPQRWSMLRRRFPAIALPHKEDICYATTNRQEAVKKVAPNVDAMIVVGAPESSNLSAWWEVAQRSGCSRAMLVERADRIDWSQFEGIATLGITAGASAPEALVDEVIDAFAERFDIKVAAHGAGRETIVFNLPRELRPSPPHDRPRSHRNRPPRAERLAHGPDRRSGASPRRPDRCALSRRRWLALDDGSDDQGPRPLDRSVRASTDGQAPRRRPGADGVLVGRAGFGVHGPDEIPEIAYALYPEFWGTRATPSKPHPHCATGTGARPTATTSSAWPRRQRAVAKRPAAHRHDRDTPGARRRSHAAVPRPQATAMTDKVIIHTDGACSGNPGPGGWGAVLQYNGTVKELKGGA